MSDNVETEFSALKEVPAVSLDQVNASSGGYQILHELSIDFPVGKASVVLGAAGSGKSTLIKVAAGLVVPDDGEVRYLGRDLYSFHEREELAFRAETGFVFQNAALWQDTTILNNVAMPIKVHRPGTSEKAIFASVSSLLRKLGYDEDLMSRPADLSAGEQKLVSIARALILEPSVLFLDDPTSNLDEDAVEGLVKILAEHKERKCTLIVSTNNSDFAYQLADYLGVIKAGRMVTFGQYEDVVDKAEQALSTSFARLKARGRRENKGRPTATEAGSEMSNRSDI